MLDLWIVQDVLLVLLTTIVQNGASREKMDQSRIQTLNAPPAIFVWEVLFILPTETVSLFNFALLATSAIKRFRKTTSASKNALSTGSPTLKAKQSASVVPLVSIVKQLAPLLQ